MASNAGIESGEVGERRRRFGFRLMLVSAAALPVLLIVLGISAASVSYCGDVRDGGINWCRGGWRTATSLTVIMLIVSISMFFWGLVIRVRARGSSGGPVSAAGRPTHRPDVPRRNTRSNSCLALGAVSTLIVASRPFIDDAASFTWWIIVWSPSVAAVIVGWRALDPLHGTRPDRVTWRRAAAGMSLGVLALVANAAIGPL